MKRIEENMKERRENNFNEVKDSYQRDDIRKEEEEVLRCVYGWRKLTNKIADESIFSVEESQKIGVELRGNAETAQMRSRV